jgi:hypothetical protein
VSLQRSAFSRQLWQSGLPAEHVERVVLTISPPDQTPAAHLLIKAEHTLLISLFPNVFP